MKTKRGWWLIAVVVVAMLCATAASYAEGDKAAAPGKDDRDAHFAKMSEELGLTPEQKAALDKDRAEFTAKAKELRDKIRQTRTSLKEELDKVSTDMAKVNSLVADLKNTIGEQIQHRIDKVMAMKKVLTPEQFSKMKAKMEERRKEFKEKRGTGGRHHEKGEARGPGHEGPEGAEGPEGI